LTSILLHALLPDLRHDTGVDGIKMFTCAQIPIFVDHDSHWRQVPKDIPGVAIGSNDVEVEQAGGS
jgi:hypothetical protein